MTVALIYSVVGLVLLVSVAVFLLSRRDEPSKSWEEIQEEAQGLWEPESLSVAERIFDPTDYWWLKRQVGFPGLAESLRQSRRRMALDWLRAVRRSFDDLLRSPDPLVPSGAPAGGMEIWTLLRHALRFHLVLAYARFVVRFFGPYHRLVPSYRWMQPVSESGGTRASCRAAGSGLLP